MYLVEVYKDQTGGRSYCRDDNYYCAGLYTTEEKAKRRAKELADKNEEVAILKIEADVDLHVYEGEIDSWNYDGSDEELGLWLGGGSYYE